MRRLQEEPIPEKRKSNLDGWSLSIQIRLSLIETYMDQVVLLLGQPGRKTWFMLRVLVIRDMDEITVAKPSPPGWLLPKDCMTSQDDNSG